MMTRTILSIEPRHLRALKARARRRGVSVAGLIRELVAASVSDEPAAKKPRSTAFERIVGLGASGQSDVSNRHDEVLGRAFRDEDAG